MSYNNFSKPQVGARTVHVIHCISLNRSRGYYFFLHNFAAVTIQGSVTIYHSSVQPLSTNRAARHIARCIVLFLQYCHNTVHCQCNISHKYVRCDACVTVAAILSICNSRVWLAYFIAYIFRKVHGVVTIQWGGSYSYLAHLPFGYNSRKNSSFGFIVPSSSRVTKWTRAGRLSMHDCTSLPLCPEQGGFRSSVHSWSGQCAWHPRDPSLQEDRHWRSFSEIPTQMAEQQWLKPRKRSIKVCPYSFGRTSPRLRTSSPTAPYKYKKLDHMMTVTWCSREPDILTFVCWARPHPWCLLE